MEDDFLQLPEKKNDIKELNIVPIIDLLVAVVFFLLLSTSFIEFNKLTLPPSGVSTISDPIAPPPISPKLVVGKIENGVKLILAWSGLEPGQMVEVYKWQNNVKTDREALVAASKKIVEDFKNRFPGERTLQLGLAGNINYQTMISVMDGAREFLPDIVLFSYDEAEERYNKSGSGASGT